MTDTDQEKTEQSYAPVAYVVAGLALAILDLSADSVKSLNRLKDFQMLFLEAYGYEISDDAISDALERMGDGKLLSVDNDQFAGTYITVQKTAFSSQFKEVAQVIPASPLGIALRAKRPWLENVFGNERFWEELNAPQDENEHDDRISEQSPVPASDRTVTLLHNSPERIEIESAMQSLSEKLRTSNEIATELGDDRERLSAELEASQAGLRPEKIRAGFIRDTVLKVLRDIGTKLKDKAIELGVDRLIALFEIILENIL